MIYYKMYFKNKTLNNEKYIESYSNNKNIINLRSKPFNFIYELNNNNIYTKAVDLWKYYKQNTNKKYLIKQSLFYKLISDFYKNPIIKNGVKCYAGIMIKTN